ncbi:MAG: 50S ribosomal protein L2 [Candidatus Magasanikbacteria bacterium CG_4_9_14_0_2_um_filter_42_11]|uniref:Large ribosomal subunit protein uL2 n=1 Tax=Candidatus Magasanikbacteria bacterium CG_4_9_14_0_2_um_filter_42_11 TaxID=1974643 RepID=A0A2M8F8L8_9BACT|nr:MAG: 50S ribosomal protein L2 [Candidatus Magasanikbacteria bacterium CG10_big_fil_rev_8_21_14_0_10_43_9]PIY92448.1 MAG: 50S ribosomal protein L2 [Candidatus Magasanikbacteria bacterium CG_4_10_14_0_8_um_filter_42_12]PJC52072.1 MAG: 50S ribosomal protein L2 [Candidatus Magasanikbacteria bacterium CG_4_9_14_0_2_um_filter_42_11]
MPVKKYKPTTPGRRGASVQDFSDITKKRPEKSLTKVLQKKSGRNNTGQITVRHRGGGVKRLYRMVDFKRFTFDKPATVEAVEYDPNRSARIVLVQFEDGSKAYYIAAKGQKVGDVLLSSQQKIEATVGNRMPLEHIPVGLFVYNVELSPMTGGSIVRGAGTSAQLQTIEGGFAQLKFPSGEIRLIPKNALATVGTVSNSEYNLVRLGKAGRMRMKGWRPTVKGRAMNPVDHPHGGGEGRTSTGLKGGPKTPWGKKAMGVKTRNKKKASNKFILHRRKGKK